MNPTDVKLANKLLAYRDNLKALQLPHVHYKIKICVGERDREWLDLLASDSEHVIADSLFRCENTLKALGVSFE